MEQPTISQNRLWTSRVMSGIVVLFMLMDSIMKFIQPDEVVESTLALGFSDHHIFTIGVIGFLCTLLYIYPKTSILGARLLLGDCAGAIDIHLRMDNPLLTHLLFQVYLAILAWGGFWLRRKSLRELIPVYRGNERI